MPTLTFSIFNHHHVGMVEIGDIHGDFWRLPQPKMAELRGEIGVVCHQSPQVKFMVKFPFFFVIMF